jgi:hypothetical protein
VPDNTIHAVAGRIFQDAGRTVTLIEQNARIGRSQANASINNISSGGNGNVI